MQIKSENINAAKPEKRQQQKKKGLLKQREKDQSEQNYLNILKIRSTYFFTLCPNNLLFKIEFLLIQALFSSSWTQTPSLATPIPNRTPIGI